MQWFRKKKFHSQEKFADLRAKFFEYIWEKLERQSSCLEVKLSLIKLQRDAFSEQNPAHKTSNTV